MRFCRNELAESGLLERSPNPADRRQNIIALTGPGRRRLVKLDGLLTEVEDHVLAPLTEPERAELARVLTAVVDHHGQHM
ncbi:MarR family winged helix-turn-helix transcriptional regulator [Streptomyces sp. NPDC008139]|uniref:MarR family winged helix-turn-helix transcriptional regulator n=1 Tax=Streptomyces sp. NPDC008139 TaxID=3364814 RepID=UPI0036EF5F1A